MNRGFLLFLVLTMIAVPLRPSARTKTDYFLIGKLTRQSVCQNGAWSEPRWEIGFVPVVHAKEETLKNLAGRVVIAQGPVDALAPHRPQRVGTDCENKAQSRGDWVWGEDGTIRLMRGNRHDIRTIPAFRADEIRVWEDWQIRKTGPRIEVKMTNTLGRALERFSIVAHYEECRGKPMIGQRDKDFGTVSPGQNRSASFEAVAHFAHTSPRDTRAYRLHSIQFVSHNRDVFFDMDVTLSEIGLGISCPDPPPRP